jgi:YbbR domain-containing protein
MTEDRRLWPMLFDNLPLKGFSLLLAIGLWTVVPDPSILHIVPGVPVRLDNIPADLALAANPTVTLEVSVRGSALRTRSLSPGQLTPRIDMTGKFEGENTVVVTPEMITVPLGVTVADIEPPQITVHFEKRVRRELLVNVVVEGSPHADYQIYDKLVNPATVLVSGPASRMAGLEAIPTEKVGVSGLQTSLMRTVRVLPDDPTLRIDGSNEVQVTVAIEERPTNFQLQGINVDIVNATTRVVVNPTVIGVVLRGPATLLAELTPANFTAVIDVDGLAAQGDDYNLEPVVRLEPATLAERIEIVGITPQQRLDVHVFPDR